MANTSPQTSDTAPRSSSVAAIASAVELIETDDQRRERVVAELLGGYTHDQLEAAFAQVRPAGYWKDPIDAWIDFSDYEVVAYAVEFFTATKLRPIEMQGEGATGVRVRVQAVGYQAGPAGDH